MRRLVSGVSCQITTYTHVCVANDAVGVADCHNEILFINFDTFLTLETYFTTFELPRTTKLTQYL